MGVCASKADLKRLEENIGTMIGESEKSQKKRVKKLTKEEQPIYSSPSMLSSIDIILKYFLPSASLKIT